MKVGSSHALSLLVSLLVLDLADAYPYTNRHSRRTNRPLSRLFGSPYTISRGTRSRYDPESRRPASRPFTIPGFGHVFPDPPRHSNLGFNLGFGGSALIDPIAGMYDTQLGAGDGATISVIGGDLGFGTAAQSRSPMGRNLDMQLDPTLFAGQNLNLDFVDAGVGHFLPAAGSRSLSAMDMNSALNSPMDIASYATNVQLSGAPTQTPFATNQLGDGISQIQIIDGTGLGAGGASQMSLSNQGLESLGLGTGNQIALGAGAVGIDSNQVGLGSGQFQAGIATENLGVNVNQLGLSANQFQTAQSQLEAAQLQGSQLGLDGLGGNQVLMDARQLQLGTGQGDFGNGQLAMSGNQQLLTAGTMGQLGMGAGQLEVAGNVQGTLGLVQPTSASLTNTQFLTSSGGMGNNILTTKDGATGGQFFTPNGESEQRIISQSQLTGDMTSQLGSAMLSQLKEAQITAGT